MVQSSKLKVILSTVDRLTTAKILSRILVESGAAACVNILPPVISTYPWKGQIEQVSEYLLLIKTSNAKKALLTLRKHHPYEVPEGIVVPIQSAYKVYEDWAKKAQKTYKKKPNPNSDRKGL